MKFCKRLNLGLVQSKRKWRSEGVKHEDVVNETLAYDYQKFEAIKHKWRMYFLCTNFTFFSSYFCCLTTNIIK
jgi:hypothetical protein